MQMPMLDSGVDHQQKTKRSVSVMVETWTTDLTKFYVSYILCKETLRSVS